jgi:hypothetical protein
MFWSESSKGGSVEKGMMVNRRELGLLALGLVTVPSATRAAPASARFRIFRDGREVGFHRVTVNRVGDSMTAKTEVEVVVRLLGVAIYRLRHDALEEWQGEMLRSARERSDEQGRVLNGVVRSVPGGLEATSEVGSWRYPPNAAPLSWWREESLGRPLFDGLTGRPVRGPAVREVLAGGQVRWKVPSEPEQGALPGVFGGEALYAATGGAWVGFSARDEDGSPIRYAPG